VVLPSGILLRSQGLLEIELQAFVCIKQDMAREQYYRSMTPDAQRQWLFASGIVLGSRLPRL
jgi:hypothetical protein